MVLIFTISGVIISVMCKNMAKTSAKIAICSPPKATLRNDYRYNAQ